MSKRLLLLLLLLLLCILLQPFSVLFWKMGWLILIYRGNTFYFCFMYYKSTYEIHLIMNMYLSFSGNRLATNVSEVIYKNEKKYKCVWCIFSSLQKVIMINCNLYWRFSVICTYFWNTVDVNCNSSLCSQLAPFRLS